MQMSGKRVEMSENNW